ncbi:MAG: NAD(P)/FAD-dependent oxidoreductase [Candidatus Aminicenantes bacterium]|nr:NAD(P)/FAD-dependent oxidoreductase [Candidatus Aminicenantes bacterium]
MTSDKSLIIIGAGMAGLSAGCYGRMNGYRVRILEQDMRPGGLCTSWERRGYTIHGNMAFLAGTGPGVAHHRIWRELGVFPEIQVVDCENMLIIEGRDGRTFYLHTNLEQLERHMRDLAPDDGRLIDDFVRGVRVFLSYQLPIDKAPELLGPGDMIRLLVSRFPLIRAMKKWQKIPLQDFARRFQSPVLREALGAFGGLFSDNLPAVFLLLCAAWNHRKSFGYPVGGGLKFARAIERRFLGLGGDVQYGSRVSKILVKDDHAVGVRLEDGRELYADDVISAADGRTTIFDWLDGKYIDARIRTIYETWTVSPCVILVSLGVSRSFPEVPWSAAGTIYPLEQPVTLGGQEIRTLRPMIYNYDPTLAPPGKTLLRLMIPASYDYWDSLRGTPDVYKAEKEKIAETIISRLDKRYPGLASQVEMRDVATPLTFERFAGNWKAGMMGWELTAKTASRSIPKTLPGLRNFYMAGQWVETFSGIPGSAISGRNVIQLLCRRDRKTFVTSVPSH